MSFAHEARGAGMSPRRRYTIIGAAIGALMAAVCGTILSHLVMGRAPQYAQVIAVTPVSRRVRTPREVCKSEEVRHDRAGRADDTYTTTEEHCVTVYEFETQPQGYDVHYRLNGVEGTVHMNHAPGPRIPLRDGRLVPEDSAAGAGAAGPT